MQAERDSLRAELDALRNNEVWAFFFFSCDL